MKKIETALSNNVYINNNETIIVKEYLNDKFKLLFGNQESIILKKLGFENKKIRNKKILIEFIPHEKFNDNDITLNLISNIVVSLKEIHSTNIKGLSKPGFKNAYLKLLTKKNIFKKKWFDEYEKKIFKKAIKILNNGKQVLLHNDIVEGNILILKSEIKFIDFEYSGVGNYIFDLASFVTERKLSSEQIEFFIDSYSEKVDKNEFFIVCAFLQIFWTRWAIYKYKKTKKEIYKDIANWKLKGYKKIVKMENLI